MEIECNSVVIGDTYIKLNGFPEIELSDCVDIEPEPIINNAMTSSLGFTTKIDNGEEFLEKLKSISKEVSKPQKIYVDEIAGYEQVRRHRKKRINKKWLKRYGVKPIYRKRELTVERMQSKIEVEGGLCVTEIVTKEIGSVFLCGVNENEE